MIVADISESISGPWRLLPPLLLAAAGIYFLLPKVKNRQVLLGALCGILALVGCATLVVRLDAGLTPDTFLFCSFSSLAILGGGLMITQRNPARAALCFTLVVMNVCGLFLLQAAPFLMAATIIIYAGAIIVTFLFVLMLAQQTGFSDADNRSREPFVASFAGFVMLGALLLMLDHTFPDSKSLGQLVSRVDAAAEMGSLAEMKKSLGDSTDLQVQLDRETVRRRGTINGTRWKESVDDLMEELGNPQATTTSLRADLKRVASAGNDLLNENQATALPAENVAGIGRVLFSDHLLAIEMGGTLLLVATIGAIAIAQRRERRTA